MPDLAEQQYKCWKAASLGDGVYTRYFSLRACVRVHVHARECVCACVVVRPCEINEGISIALAWSHCNQYDLDHSFIYTLKC